MAEIYGEAWIETARDKLYALLNTLKSTMSSGYDPTFSYLYERHSVAKLLLNAVTIDLEEITESDVEWQTTTIVRYLLTLSVRVHTAYSDGISDGQKQARLLGSIANKLKANYDLGNNYHLEDVGSIKVNQAFSESDTQGGELMITISVNISHTQE